MKAYLTVGEMGRMFGLNVQTLHYYDKIGLFCPQLRNPETGRRRYKFDQVYQLATIRYLRKLGYPLEDVRVYLNSRSPVHTMDLLRERSAALRAQWQELMRIDEAILRKLQFMEEKQEHIFWDGVRRVPFPERRYIPIGSEEILYMKDSFYFYPTIAHRVLRGKSEIFWCVCGRAGYGRGGGRTARGVAGHPPHSKGRLSGGLS